MPEVNVEINGRRYRMACEEGQQGHLIALAERFNASVEGLKGAVGEIGDTRLTVMAGIAVLDELAEAERRIAALEAEVETLTAAGHQIADELEATEQAFAGKLDQAAKVLNSIAGVLDETAPLQS
ncbi:cell division protein ZapA [Devosia sp. BK]|jgi:cell division protein ZapA|uniref:cell division protein ZapA n=1 Tax=unclassified Devosia TaxID=196773 RepID=UPI0007146815|nr:MULTISPECIES: cell division protein ZapA [unclassified Devosia]KQN77276.1 cell division protein ZapA [Devosia sp. Leaf64]KQT47116.1 cell division protein ZapA [Devosia sp. Leaf420]MDV3252938.1 cell division protein ZapA [Devosia sp. BK]